MDQQNLGPKYLFNGTILKKKNFHNPPPDNFYCWIGHLQETIKECESFELRHLKKCSDNYSVISRHATLMINGFPTSDKNCEEAINIVKLLQQLFWRSQKQMSAICSLPSIGAFLNQSTFTIHSVLYFRNQYVFVTVAT